jgi:hypothetical protein
MTIVRYAPVVLALTAGIGLPQSLETNRKVDALISASALEVQLQDYPSAWRTLGQAAQINPASAKVHAAQEDVAMAWLENIHARDDQGFSDVVKKLESALTRGVASAPSSSRKADLMAHLGWSQFLLWRGRKAKSDPAKVFAEAIKIDVNNPYAEAMWGFWILYPESGTLEDAQRHFSLALTTGRQRAYVRNLQLTALMNAGSEPSSNHALIDYEMIRVANEMRKEHVVVDPGNQDKFLAIYFFNMLHPDESKFIRVIPPGEHLATFHWLFDGMEFDESKARLQSYYLSALQETAGQRDEALAGYRLVQQKTRGESGPLIDAAETGIRRLTGKKSK